MPLVRSLTIWRPLWMYLYPQLWGERRSLLRLCLFPVCRNFRLASVIQIKGPSIFPFGMKKGRRVYILEQRVVSGRQKWSPLRFPQMGEPWDKIWMTTSACCNTDVHFARKSRKVGRYWYSDSWWKKKAALILNVPQRVGHSKWAIISAVFLVHRESGDAGFSCLRLLLSVPFFSTRFLYTGCRPSTRK